MSIDHHAINTDGVEPKRAERLMRNILKLEESNNKSKALSDQEMVRKITKMVEEEADCY